jgi:hypothetical protein
MKLNPTPTQDRSIVGSRMRFQVKKIMKEGDRRKNAKKGFTEMYKHKKMKKPIRG